jgi:WD40 repeat protein
MIILWETSKKDDGILHSTLMISKELCSSIANVCFSPSQKLLAATCNDEDHKLVIYNLNELKELEKKLTSTKTGIICFGPLTKSLVFDIKFTLDEKSLVAATVK